MTPTEYDRMKADKDRILLDRQERLSSALWGFAYELQHERLETKCEGDGTMMNLESLRRAEDVILAIFQQKRIEVQ